MIQVGAVLGFHSDFESRSVVDEVQRFEHGSKLGDLLGGESVAVEELLFLIDREVMQREREFPLRREIRGAVFPIEDRGDFSFVVHEDIF